MAVDIDVFFSERNRLGAVPSIPSVPSTEVPSVLNPEGTPIGHSPVTIGTPANGLSINGSQVLSLGLASAGSTGALSSTDWNTFNNKLNLTSPITGYTVGSNTALAATDTILQAFGKVQGQINARISGTIASGQVAFGTGANTIGGDSGLTWDNTTKRLLISGGTYPVLRIERTTTVNNTIVLPYDIKSKTSVDMLAGFGSGMSFTIEDNTASSIIGRLQFLRGSTDNLGIFQVVIGNGSLTPIHVDETGRLGLLTALPTNTLDVNGTTRIRTLSNATGNFVTTSATGVLQQRTAAEVRSDLGLTSAITGTGVAGQVAFGTGANTIGGDSGLVWDNVNKMLQLAEASINISRNSGNSIIRLNRSDKNISSAMGGIEFSNFINQVIGGIAVFSEGGDDLGGIRFFTSSNNNQTSLYSLSERWRINNTGNLIAIGGNRIASTSNGNINITPNGTGLVGIATTSPTNTLDVNGTARIRSLTGTTGYLPLLSSTGVMGQSVAYNADTGVVINGTFLPSGAVFSVNGVSFFNNFNTGSNYNLLSIDFGENKGFGYNADTNEIFIANNTSSKIPVKIDTDAPTDSLVINASGNVSVGGQLHSPVVAKGNSSTAVTFDWNDGNIQTVTLTANCTFTFSNPQSGASYQIIITQDATGSRTITWPAGIYWEGKTIPSLTGTANSRDIITITYDGSNYNALIARNFGT